MTNPIKRAWRSMWFMDDDDRTPQGKLTHGCFYVVYVFFGFMILYGAIFPTIDYFCGGCVSTQRAHRPW